MTNDPIICNGLKKDAFLDQSKVILETEFQSLANGAKEQSKSVLMDPMVWGHIESQPANSIFALAYQRYLVSDEKTQEIKTSFSKITNYARFNGETYIIESTYQKPREDKALEFLNVYLVDPNTCKTELVTDSDIIKVVSSL